MTNNVHSVVRRSVPCYFCNEFLEERYLPEHVNHCAAVLEECPNKCGVYIPRRNIEGHRRSCNKKMRNSQINIQESMWKEKVFSVLTLLRSAINDGEREQIRLKDSLSRNLNFLHSQQESLAALRLNVMESVEEIHTSNALLNERLNDLEVINDDMQHCTSLSFQRISEQLKLFEGDLISEQSNHKHVPLDDWFKELKDLKTFVARESIRISDTWQDHSRRINDIKLELEMKRKILHELISKHDIMSEKVNTLSEEICKHSEILVNQKTDIKSLKFQMKENLKYIEELIVETCKPEPSINSHPCALECSEFTSTNGRLIWRIDRYKQEMNEAKENDRPLYSPIFFNKEYGYTLRMELFLNGRGQWKDRHIIGCLRVENGKWDPLLDWPCVFRAIVILRDQDNPANDLRKVVKTIGRDKNNTDDPDRESGLYMFVPHTTLSRYPGYTKNNVMFLDIQVKDIKTSVSTTSLA